ncbi:MAG: U32 family peptidase [Clostridia bacterium]|nr:U32 family peptidase [Clostridia bacterium]
MSAKNRIAESIRRAERLPELLSPAGSPLALEAAIDGGADAVYLGGRAFNARINAKNFTDEELKRGIELAHSYGVKIYLAANTLVYDRELDGFLRSAEYAYKCGAEALIVADLGAASEVAKRIPIELHASTQCSCHSLLGAEALEKIGFSRVVCAREMSAENIKRVVDNSPLEVEVFVHGALCVCHSGQCLFSSLVGGRSGNRGECAQPCRLPFVGRGKGNEYPLSLKDLTLAEHIGELCNLGVASLKIEGRMKSPEYVREVTATWRKLLDERRNASKSEVRELEGVFSRDGFTDAYFVSKIGNGMLGVRSEAQKKATRELAPFNGIERKISVEASVSVRRDCPMTLTLTRNDTGESVCVTGDEPLIARTAPTDEQGVIRSISKLGDTPFVLTRVLVTLDEGLMVPVSALNSLRRRAVEELCASRRFTAEPIKDAEKSTPKNRRKARRTAVFYNPTEIPESAFDYFDLIYTPLEKYDGATNGVMLPPVVLDSESEEIRRMLARAVELGATDALVSNAGQIEISREAGLTVHGNIGLNVTNTQAAALYEGAGIEEIMLSPELTMPQMRDIGGATLAVVYGRIPLMVTEKCVGKEIGDCNKCESGRLMLTDRRGVSFPVLRAWKHRSLVFNSVPIYMADRTAELDRAGLSMRHFIFSTETRQEADGIIQAYKKRTPPKDATKIKRIK